MLTSSSQWLSSLPHTTTAVAAVAAAAAAAIAENTKDA